MNTDSPVEVNGSLTLLVVVVGGEMVTGATSDKQEYKIKQCIHRTVITKGSDEMSRTVFDCCVSLFDSDSYIVSQWASSLMLFLYLFVITLLVC